MEMQFILRRATQLSFGATATVRPEPASQRYSEQPVVLSIYLLPLENNQGTTRLHGFAGGVGQCPGSSWTPMLVGRRRRSAAETLHQQKPAELREEGAFPTPRCCGVLCTQRQWEPRAELEDRAIGDKICLSAELPPSPIPPYTSIPNPHPLGTAENFRLSSACDAL